MPTWKSGTSLSTAKYRVRLIVPENIPPTVREHLSAIVSEFEDKSAELVKAVALLRITHGQQRPFVEAYIAQIRSEIDDLRRRLIALG